MNNYFMLIGRLTRNPEKNKKNENVVNISIAISRPFKNKEGYYDTDFLNITLFKNIGKATLEYCKKGDLIAVKGSIRNNNWQDEKGKIHYENSLVAEKITFLATNKNVNKNNNENNNNEVKNNKDNMTKIYEDFGNEFELSSDDLPF